jgi:hypothetical protein
MSLHTHFYAPRKTLSWRIQIGHKSGYLLLFIIIIIIIDTVNIKPPRHRFGFSLSWGWQYIPKQAVSPILFGFPSECH